MKKMILSVGGVETLTFFARQLGAAFEKRGYEIFYFDVRNGMQSAKKACRFLETGASALVTFNFQGLEKEAGVYKENEGYLWDAYDLPCYNIAADHPYFYHDRLRELPKKYRHISIDRNHQKYLEHFYPEFASAGFLPLAGTALSDSMQEARVFEVVMAGNYTPMAFFESYMERIDREYAAFYREIIDDLLAHPACTVEEIALAHIRRELGEQSDRDLRSALHNMMFLDLYARNYWRGKAVAALVDAGIRVDVVGKGWDGLHVRKPENLTIHPQTDTASCLRMLQQAKLSLNVMPWFKDGAHDRVFSSVLNGAVCLSDPSAYLCEALKEGQGVAYYDLQRLETLSEQASRLLADEDLRRQYLKAGFLPVQANHTWASRADALCRLLDPVLKN